MSTEKMLKIDIITNWWPVTDEEWEQLNYPEKFRPMPTPVDKQ